MITFNKNMNFSSNKVCKLLEDNKLLEGVIGESTARKWLEKFKNCNFDIDDAPLSGRPSEFDKDHLKALLKEESRQTSRELAEKINCDQKTILNHFHSL